MHTSPLDLSRLIGFGLARAFKEFNLGGWDWQKDAFTFQVHKPSNCSRLHQSWFSDSSQATAMLERRLPLQHGSSAMDDWSAYVSPIRDLRPLGGWLWWTLQCTGQKAGAKPSLQRNGKEETKMKITVQYKKKTACFTKKKLKWNEAAKEQRERQPQKGLPNLLLGRRWSQCSPLRSLQQEERSWHDSRSRRRSAYQYRPEHRPTLVTAKLHFHQKQWQNVVIEMIETNNN